jgi:hypothetical protein
VCLYFLDMFTDQNVMSAQGASCPSCAFSVDTSGMLSRTHDPACDVSLCTFLALINKGIAAIAEGTFQGMGKLEALNLQGNRLVSLPAEVFRDLTSLDQLVMSSNSISNISQGAFSTLSSLTFLDLGSNQLASLQPGVFVGLTSLKSLNLDSNILTGISDSTFQGLGASLNTLQLSYNRLTSISSKAFHGMSGLTRPSFSSNLLRILPRDLFASMEAAIVYAEGYNNPLLCVPERMIQNSYQVQLLCPSEVRLSSQDPVLNACCCMHAD